MLLPSYGLSFSVQALTGAEYPYVQYGKPTRATYRFAEHLLREQIAELSREDGVDCDEHYLPNVYVKSSEVDFGMADQSQGI